MARVIHEMGRIGTVRAGRDASGAVKSNKVVVWGRINVTSYATGGEAVAPRDLGLDTIDFIKCDVRTTGAAGTTEPSNGAPFGADYIQSTQKLMIYPALDDGTEATSTHLSTVYYIAAGDATVADLT